MRDTSLLKARIWTVAIAVASLCAGQAKAADQVWTGAVSADVTTAGNWADGNPQLMSFSPIVFGSNVVGGTMALQPWATIGGQTVTSTTPITINGSHFLFGNGAPISLAAAGSDLTVNPAWLQGWGDINFDVGAGRTLTMNGALGENFGDGWAHNAGLVKNGAGTAVLNAAPISTAHSNTTNGYYTGPTSINAGTLQVTYNGIGNAGIGTLPVGSSITVASGATLLATTNALGYETSHAGDTLTVNNGGSLTSAAGSVVPMPYALNVVGGTIASVDGGDGSVGSFYYGSTQGTFTSGTDGTAATISAQNFNLQGASFNVTDGAGAVDLNVSGNLIGGALIKNGAGVMRLSGNNSYSGNTTVNGGTLQVAGGGLLAGGFYTGAIGIGTGANLQYSGTGVQLLFGVVSGAGSLTKDTSGSGVLYLSGSNTYSGATTVSAGVLKFANVAATGSTSGITANGGGSVAFDSGAAGGTIAAPISLSGDGSGNGALNTYTPGGQVTFSGPVTMAGGAMVIAGGNNSTINFTNAVSGTGPLVFAGFTGGGGTKSSMVLSGSSDFTGALSVTPWLGNTQVTLSGGDNRLPTTALVAVHGDGGLQGALDLNGNNQMIGGLSDSQGWGGDAGTRTVVNTSGTPVTLTLNTTSNQSSGVSIGGTDINGTVGNNLSLVKMGSATQTLSGSSSYTGATTITGGKLAVNGSLGSTAVSVGSGGTLGGSGSIAGAVSVDGILSPGNSPGVITLGSLLLGGSSTTLIEIAGTSRGTSYDGIDITTSGGLTYGGILSLDFSSLGSTVADFTTFDIFSFLGSSSGNFSSVSSTGLYAGTWTSKGSGNFELVSGAQTLTFSQSAGDIVVVPEPTSLALLGVGLTMGVAIHRRRRRTSPTAR